ncbi:MAG: hypothetical protein JO366_20875 [Methylobacteriaceae bacterium]|nr:hypothetical protein [Methylobacteriaceae bacterium]MBV9247258.1 hypothetical protein [Methylobacteriaceae bacterium]
MKKLLMIFAAAATLGTAVLPATDASAFWPQPPWGPKWGPIWGGPKWGNWKPWWPHPCGFWSSWCHPHTWPVPVPVSVPVPVVAPLPMPVGMPPRPVYRSMPALPPAPVTAPPAPAPAAAPALTNCQPVQIIFAPQSQQQNGPQGQQQPVSAILCMAPGASQPGPLASQQPPQQ